MKAMSPNSAPSASSAASTSRSTSVSPASIAARNIVPPASMSRITIAMSDRSPAACSSRAARTSATDRLISASRFRVRSGASIDAERARPDASSRR
jgi:hypothetical protein